MLDFFKKWGVRRRTWAQKNPCLSARAVNRIALQGEVGDVLHAERQEARRFLFGSILPNCLDFLVGRRATVNEVSDCPLCGRGGASDVQVPVATVGNEPVLSCRNPPRFLARDFEAVAFHAPGIRLGACNRRDYAVIPRHATQQGVQRNPFTSALQHLVLPLQEDSHETPGAQLRYVNHWLDFSFRASPPPMGREPALPDALTLPQGQRPDKGNSNLISFPCRFHANLLACFVLPCRFHAMSAFLWTFVFPGPRKVKVQSREHLARRVLPSTNRASLLARDLLFPTG